MKKLLTAFALTAILALTASAAKYSLPKEEPIATIDFPAGWSVELNDESLDAYTEDEEIYINIEVNDADSIEGAIEETIGYLKKNKVTIDKKSEKKTEGQINGLDVVDFSWDGQHGSDETKVSLTIVQVNKDKGLLILYWASPEGEKKHQAALTKIMKSLKPTKS